MLETSHALVAGAIAGHTKDPATAVSLSFLSHFIMDAVPHWDFGTNWRGRRKLYTGLVAIIDVIVGFGLGYLIFGQTVPLPLLFAAIAASMIPDWLETPWYIFFANHQKKQPAKQAGFPEKLAFGIYKLENQFHNKTKFPLGVITQIVTVAFFFVLLK
ncbi:MAG: hypothetical protein UW37_C0035G0006 [Candidatus Gottesmanbacteria bacterium GW2011_GWA2_44_17]|uniref:Uncharacterized protein n=3 Tax=Candidatus Gottesmaniibacteriota TaxID=1752720 RepID=A0A0G1IGY2_9BACT|nr:MAG: hypothetical protein UV63_C0023G0010 [Microgenomates group bacterium GW2011_GWC1_43_11]KKT35722.1 MAG: hypothetical protein UW22_C0049G0002 [Candidatus Gottesmanbacteria bacterium GW2011_GWB1_44_11c]KKT45992.1 MAG: hypothetical protein UW37_C0035G0006 [Candidatus Gottesmanbacteria bacterium GW2011_GWA2_44_17]KKT58445.1 MAG: hypothetical protein UW52_C0060G0002 [Candidatus Gottesmanbacteria bacterium GW2011_GWA1_44_24b]HCM82352.1 hypothetical protein [Patescibacteria group bacterium]